MKQVDIESSPPAMASTSTIDLLGGAKMDQQQSVTHNIYIARGSRIALRFTVYHRLSLLVIVPNLAVIVYMSIKKELFAWPTVCLDAVAANVAVAVLIRQDHIINMLFCAIGHIPHWMPLLLRRHAAKLYHLGGIHSGSGIAAGIWYLFFVTAIIRQQPTDAPMDAQAAATISLCVLMMLLLAQMLVLSIPIFRARFHNFWEMMHRFSGWLLLICFWAFFIEYSLFDSRKPEVSLAELFYLSPSFYLLSITTISITLPWLYLRRVRLHVELLSQHAVRLHFDYLDVSACKTPRFSTNPWLEWHSFASIPNTYTKGYSVIISRAGDWTSKMIDDTPLLLWTRGRPARGVLYMAKMFRSILCVGTGSGIAPILGLLTITNTRYKILWSAPDPEATFGSDIVRRVLQADPLATIWNTKTHGRPDLIAEAKRTYDQGDIEAVFVISNAKVTADVVFGLESRGVPAFGPIFDS